MKPGRIVLTAMVLGHTAFANPKVVFVAEDLDVTFAKRLSAELEATGFSVEARDMLGAFPEEGTVAAVRVFARRRRAEVFRVRDGRYVLSLVVPERTWGDEETHTLRVAEQLRALLTPLAERSVASPVTPAPSTRDAHELPAPAPGTRSEPEMPSPSLAKAIDWDVSPPELPPRDRAISIGAGVAAAVEPGGLGFDLTLRGRYLPTWLGVEAQSAIPLVTSTLRRVEGEATTSTTWFGVGGIARLTRKGSLASVTLGVGLGVASVRMVGTANPPLVSQKDSVLATAPYATGEVSVRAGERLWLYASPTLALAVPSVDILFAGARIDSWGAPYALVSAGTRLDW